ncbi:hypothetical protein ACFL0H_14175 [Thermodesulfobacteriota bacterium]
MSLQRSILIDIIKFLFVIGAITWLIARGAEKQGYNISYFEVWITITLLYLIPAVLVSLGIGHLELFIRKSEARDNGQ